jgi:uncharacterized protein (DUF305 family)
MRGDANFDEFLRHHFHSLKSKRRYSVKKSLVPLAVAAALAIATPAAVFAQEGHEAHGAMQGANSPAAQAYKQAMDTMHGAMSSQEYTGDADVDFARGMIPHHQAAIDMAKAVLEYGKDPEIRQLAEDIVAAQEREIKQLETWLDKKAK